MMEGAFFFLLLCLKTLTVPVESFPASSLSHTKISADVTIRRETKIYRAKANDDDVDQSTDSSSLIPTEAVEFDWKAIANHVFDESVESAETLHSKPIILFDGVCNLCNGGVNYAIDHDKNGKFRFASLQSNVAKSLLLRDGKDPFTTSDVVLVTAEKNYYSSEAVARIMASLDLPVLKLLGNLGQITPSFARNFIYKIVSGNRFVLGENDSCRMDFDGEYTWRFVSDPPESISSLTEEDKNAGE
ncbi:unnamed protein product [Pseudo-nitzschia multistriata]|uniref:Thiol-disulfide oxidoreductase DCC n=1 Tax=Pseudo-nitzschia multistriata TaxID=183589 RepID=A0A448Z493_9STRA|nr:unnamed protein product [Pseudo-nitzschia multistriata]